VTSRSRGDGDRTDAEPDLRGPRTAAGGQHGPTPATLAHPGGPRSHRLQPLLEEIARKDEIIRTLQLQLNKSMENEAGALAAAKAAGNALNAAKAQITREQKRSVKAGQVQQVVDHWRLLRPRTGPEFGEPGSKSFAVIEKALVLMASDPAGRGDGVL
jgi:hypothetical protein